MVEISKKVGTKDEEKVNLTLSGEVKNCISRLKHGRNIFLILKISHVFQPKLNFGLFWPSTCSHFNFQPENHWSIGSILHQTPERWSATQALPLPHSWIASSHHLNPFLGRTRVTSVRFWSPALRWWRSVCSQVESCLTVKRDVTKKKKRGQNLQTMFSEPKWSLKPQHS